MCPGPNPFGESVSASFLRRCPEDGICSPYLGSYLTGDDSFDSPESSISRRLGLASGLGIRLTPLLRGSVNFRRVGLGEWAPEGPTTSGSGILTGESMSASTGGKLPTVKGETKTGVLTISSRDASEPVLVSEGPSASGVRKRPGLFRRAGV